ncbi:MAG: DUF3662 and FHA domain-containing protein [Thermomicrobiales bacterium]
MVRSVPGAQGDLALAWLVMRRSPLELLSGDHTSVRFAEDHVEIERLAAGRARSGRHGQGCFSMLSRLEQAIERLVEGGIASAFRLRVQPAEIGRHLERAMLNGRRSSVGGSLVPNAFTVRLHPDDASQFAGWEAALCRELERWLAELIYARGLSTLGPVVVAFTADAAVPRRAVRVDAIFDAERRLVGRERVAPRLRLIPERPELPRISLEGEFVRIGRGEGNDVVIADGAVSRHHARLEWDGTNWVIVDLGSTNGTWVNGETIEHARLKAGDVVAFGGVRYRVRE